MQSKEQVLDTYRDFEAMLDRWFEAECVTCAGCPYMRGTGTYVAGDETKICHIVHELYDAVKRKDGGKRGRR